MLDEIRAGNVATVIIKDQSRIGRDVVEVGLLKRTFDEYHVRFIAANDNLDTANGFDIMSIFRDVINEWYVADTSRKIKTVFKSRMEKGLRCSGSVCYGYRASKEEKGEWIIDEEAAAVVRRIFQSVLAGETIASIARLCSFPLLILDDFGMERSTEYGLEQIYNVVDSRYRSRKPLIVTTNLTLEELQHPEDTAHSRIYDRLLEIRPVITVSPVNDELLSAVGKLTAEYGKIGGNLNQIARCLNEYGAPYNTLSQEVRAATAELAALKFEVLQKVGEAVGNIQTYQL